MKASRTVCADEFIRRFSEGYQTEVKERGNLLSQGQKQLISFARTLLSDPSILVLDAGSECHAAGTYFLYHCPQALHHQKLR